MIVVIPSNRSINLEYLQPLIDSGARFIIVDDSEGSIRVPHPAFKVYSWQDRRALLGDNEIAIPRRNGACRDLGFVMAWKEADNDEIIVALDDDCQVYTDTFAGDVERSLSTAPRPVAHCTGLHLNVFDIYAGAPNHLFPRGFPYAARGSYQRCTYTQGVATPVKFSLGLWKNVFDINAIDKINGPTYDHPDIELAYSSVIIPPGKYISVCSMNMQFRREMIPAAYQLPMHVPVMPHWVIDRYGDIWGGFILKLLMDIKGDAMAAGGPMIRHMKDGNFQRNLWQENVCHMVNDEFIAILEDTRPQIRPAGYVDMMAALAEIFNQRTNGASTMLKPYLAHLNAAIRAWITILS
jgi:Reversibly glycosylated polypeptide